MYRVILGGKELASARILVNACLLFILEFKKMVEYSSVRTMYETSGIETEIGGRTYRIDADAIDDFCHTVGILEADGSISKRIPSSIPEEREQELFIVHGTS